MITPSALKALLAGHGIGQAQFAKEAGCHPSNVSGWLNGYHGYDPLPGYLLEAAERLGLLEEAERAERVAAE